MGLYRAALAGAAVDRLVETKGVSILPLVHTPLNLIAMFSFSLTSLTKRS